MPDPEVVPFTAAEVEWLRPKHYRGEDGIRCHWCEADWPCNTARFVVTIDRLVRLADALRVDDEVGWMAHLPMETEETAVTGLRFCIVCDEDWPCVVRRKGPG